MEDGSTWVTSLEQVMLNLAFKRLILVVQAVQVLSEGKTKILVARRIGLKDAGAKTLADTLKKNKGLEEIYLCQNDIGPAGAKV